MYMLLLLTIFLSSILAVSYADDFFVPYPGSLSSGYGITTDWHGVDVPIGSGVTAYIVTTDPLAVEVKIIWLTPEPNREDRWIEILDLDDDGGIYTYNDKTVSYAISTERYPDLLGDWGVKAIFYDEAGEPCNEPPYNDVLSIKATSFFSTPEIPYGTLAATLSMIAALFVVIKIKY